MKLIVKTVQLEKTCCSIAYNRNRQPEFHTGTDRIRLCKCVCSSI